MGNSPCCSSGCDPQLLPSYKGVNKQPLEDMNCPTDNVDEF